MMGKGFSYTVSDEKLKKWMALPAKMKLEWLEEVNEFLSKAMPEESKKIMAKFRKAEI